MSCLVGGVNAGNLPKLQASLAAHLGLRPGYNCGDPWSCFPRPDLASDSTPNLALGWISGWIANWASLPLPPLPIAAAEPDHRLRSQA